MRTEISCGFLLFQIRPRRSFLVLLDGDRHDLPKGKIKRGETELSCALRELEEESGVHGVRLIPDFRYVTRYITRGSDRVAKTVVLFAGEVEGPVSVVAPDHDDYAWFPWDPPHNFEEHPTLQGVLRAYAAHERAHAAVSTAPAVVTSSARRAS